MKNTTVDRLDAEFAEFPVLVAGPPSLKVVQDIQDFAGFIVPESYRDFVVRYGSAIVGSYCILGSGVSTAMGANESSVLELTNRFRADNWPGSDDALVISMDLAGNAIMLARDGRIVCFDHDAGETDILAPTFEAFIIDCCLKPS